MQKKNFSMQKLGYISPTISEFEVKVEAGFAESNTSLEAIAEESADSDF